MKFKVKRSADGTQTQIVISPSNNQESQDLYDMYNRGSILALGSDSKGRYQLVLGTSAPERQWV